MTRTCDECGDEFVSIGRHWGHNPSHRPELKPYQHEVLTGILMGDGSVKKHNQEKYNPKLRISVKNKKYIEYLSCTILGDISTGMKEHNSGDHKMHCLDTISHPELERYSSWYGSGEKVWPENIIMTPTTLKHLYVCDGCLVNPGIAIACENERGNGEKLKKYFSNIDIPEPQIYNSESYGIRWNADESMQVIQYMGAPVPGFKYKWDIV
jgi:hypothetical protein